MKYILNLILILFCFQFFGQQTPVLRKKEIIAIVGATAHIGNGKVIKNSVLIFEDGIITSISDEPSPINTKKGKIIYATGKHIYPGFIAPNSTLGLAEIDAVKATKDEREIGMFNPHIRSIIAYNTESKVTETAKVNGVLMAQITPRGGWISGTSSIVQFDAWNYEDALIKENDGIHLNWPSSFQRNGWWAQPKPTTLNKNYAKQVTSISDFFENAKADNSTSENLKNNAMQGLFTGEKKLFVHVNGEKEMIDLMEFKNKKGIKKLVIIGGYYAYKITPLLKENKVAVILKRVHSLPNLEDEDVKLPFKLPKILSDSGIIVAFDPAGGMERMQTRNLPFFAGTAVAYGLDYEKAVEMLTLNAAKILGIEKQTGSLEVGKDATFFISEGDALDMRTNKVTSIFIQGRNVSLDTHQKQLYRKFTKKYEGVKSK